MWWNVSEGHKGIGRSALKTPRTDLHEENIKTVKHALSVAPCVGGCLTKLSPILV